MTNEELYKEAEESLDKRLGTYAYINKQNCYRNYVDGYTDGAEPREKRIADLEKKIKKIRDYLAYKIPCELMNEATNKIWNMVSGGEE